MIDYKLIEKAEMIAAMITYFFGAICFVASVFIGQINGLDSYRTAAVAMLLTCCVSASPDLRIRIRRYVYQKLYEHEALRELKSRRCR